MIKRLAFYDMDGTLMDTPLPEDGKKTWKEVTGEDYPHAGWWGRPESLSTDVFDIKPFPTVLSQLKDDTARPDTQTVLLTNRIERLRPHVENLLMVNGIRLDVLDLKSGGEEKDERILRHLENNPNVKEISVFDDRDKELKLLSPLKDKVDNNIIVNIYKADDGKLSLVESYNRLKSIVNEEIKRFSYL